jgi:perosamine synthetase
MDAIAGVACRHNLWVIEDAAEAHCARYKGRAVGGLAAMATFSFYGNKILSSGEGGAITLNDPAMAARLMRLRGQGMDPTRRYYFPVIGYNYRLTNIACALLCAQIESAPRILARRREIFEGYRNRLMAVSGLGFQPVAAWADPAPWLFCLTIDEEKFGHDRDAVMAHLSDEKIETRPFFIPIHTLPPYAGPLHGTLPNTMRLAAQGMNLPTHTGLTDADLDRIAAAILSLARN